MEIIPIVAFPFMFAARFNCNGLTANVMKTARQSDYQEPYPKTPTLLSVEHKIDGSASV